MAAPSSSPWGENREYILVISFSLGSGMSGIWPNPMFGSFGLWLIYSHLFIQSVLLKLLVVDVVLEPLISLYSM